MYKEMRFYKLTAMAARIQQVATKTIIIIICNIMLCSNQMKSKGDGKVNNNECNSVLVSSTVNNCKHREVVGKVHGSEWCKCKSYFT